MTPNSSAVPRYENSPVTTAARATEYITSAVASLNIPSPSRMVTSRSGRFSLRATAVAATGSGGETIAPRIQAGPQPSPTEWATTATAAAVHTVRPTASASTAPAWARNSDDVVRWVAAKSSGGSTIGSTRSGLISSGEAKGISPTASPKMRQQHRLRDPQRVGDRRQRDDSGEKDGEQPWVAHGSSSRGSGPVSDRTFRR